VIRGILFDYGETLVKSASPWADVKPVALHSVYATLKRESMNLSYAEFVGLSDSVFGEFAVRELKDGRDFPDALKYQKMIAEVFPRRSGVWRRMIASWANDAFWTVVLKNYELQKNARRSLDTLREMGVKLAIVSNHHNPEALICHLGKIGILEYFSPVIASAQLKFRKPDRRIFAKCLSAMRLKPEEAIFVGDSLENDVAGAKGAGMISVLIQEDSESMPVGDIEPDYVAKDLLEIPKIVVARHANA
jgi:HAD superfamily hydrolase (TIGR01509 family)